MDRDRSQWGRKEYADEGYLGTRLQIVDPDIIAQTLHAANRMRTGVRIQADKEALRQQNFLLGRDNHWNKKLREALSCPRCIAGILIREPF